ncbi:flagellar basal body rod protein FlgC [Ligilactobacillus sp. WILCCON 0076]|uniref:Flagellar basal-body rod protein FlgC n=1 Tax=Ligilactobacillus ubinensis TaxID=2876789 RepID=A0A9X2FIY1_9LACO|nr:flagellar basal body rod protein FlgC [Ligilactobacillus ubinensis]MCP0886254.1 flagellar basal body rod protein FlgC [Ligilactobacillus ubinensis]
MSVFNGLQINASGLALERLKLDTISSNIANLNTDQTTTTSAYHAKSVVFSENVKSVSGDDSNFGGTQSSGVKVLGIDEDTEKNLKYDPTNEAADSNGYVEESNVNLSDEMVNMIQAMRTYEANTSSEEANKTILSKALEISKS